MTKPGAIVLTGILLLVSLGSGLAVAEHAPVIGRITRVPDGCSCSLHPLSSEGIVFWNDLGAEPALMFIDGKPRKLRKVIEEPEGEPVRGEWFEGDGYVIYVRYRLAPSTCPKWKVEHDEGCEYVDLFATIRILRQSDGTVRVIEVKGFCGC